MSGYPGPFESQAEAMAPVHTLAALTGEGGNWAARELFDKSLAGIELGDYDLRIVRWLRDWDAPTLAAVAGITERAKAMQP